MKVEVYQEYEMKENSVTGELEETTSGIGTPEVFEVRRPLARQIWSAQKLDPDNMDTPEAWKIVSDLLTETTVKSPEEYTNGDGKLNCEVLPADCFFELFGVAMKAVVRASKKLSQL